ncbi:hypothetical protein QTP86_032967, partial [Hemibagrus guttatus]
SCLFYLDVPFLKYSSDFWFKGSAGVFLSIRRKKNLCQDIMLKDVTVGYHVCTASVQREVRSVCKIRILMQW